MDCCRCETVTETESLCPCCFKRVPAVREARGEDIFLVKTCQEHGEFSTLIWRGKPEFTGWKRKGSSVRSGSNQTETLKGCPFDCGICPSHRKNACTAVIEVTSRCNLSCPVCFADSGRDAADPDLHTIDGWYRHVLQASGPDIIIQLSGGEPTVRGDLPTIVEMGRAAGFPFIQVNTNGLRIAREENFAYSLRQAGASSVFLQFDGTGDDIYRRLRGASLYADKMLAIEKCAANDIGVVLVATLVPGLNTQNIGAILKLALELAPTVRGVHFQPVGYFGRYSGQPGNDGRITLPEIMHAIEEQTEGLMHVEDFSPPGWENSLCSFHGTFLPLPGGGLKALTGHGFSGCCDGGSEGRAVSFTARQWSAPEKTAAGNDGLLPAGGCCDAGIESFDGFLDQVRTRMLSVSCMAFQDAWNLDLERAKDCCIHVVAPDGKMIPFCLYNLTSTSGKRLYRGC